MQKKARISLWDMSSADISVSTPMERDFETDVAIVGGGFTGLSTALHLATQGVECHVLEANKVGHGGSGRNCGLVNPGVWIPPQNVLRSLGQAQGEKFLRAMGEAPEYVFLLIEKYGIDCEASRSGTIHAAHSPSGYRELTERAAEWKRLGAPVELLDRDLAEKAIGSPHFYGGLLDHRAGSVNPMGYARGLAKAAVTEGVPLHTGVKVTALKRDGNKWVLETTQGRVRANRVVLGTNAYTDELWPGLKQIFTIIRFFQFATVPLGDRVSHILPGGQALWDTGLVMRSVRRDAFNRLIIGSMGKLTGTTEDGLSHRWASKSLQRIFPDLGEVEWEKAWDGQIALTPDHIPRIHQLDVNLYTPIGYNGRGITTGTMLGKAMANYLSGGSEEDLPLPISRMRKVRTAPIAAGCYEAGFKANQLYQSII